MTLEELRAAVRTLRRLPADTKVVAIDVETGQPVDVTDLLPVRANRANAKTRVEIHLG